MRDAVLARLMDAGEVLLARVVVVLAQESAAVGESPGGRPIVDLRFWMDWRPREGVLSSVPNPLP
jgi:hypothetical protein